MKQNVKRKNQKTEVEKENNTKTNKKGHGREQVKDEEKKEE